MQYPSRSRIFGIGLLHCQHRHSFLLRLFQTLLTTAGTTLGYTDTAKYVSNQEELTFTLTGPEL